MDLPDSNGLTDSLSQLELSESRFSKKDREECFWKIWLEQTPYWLSGLECYSSRLMAPTVSFAKFSKLYKIIPIGYILDSNDHKWLFDLSNSENHLPKVIEETREQKRIKEKVRNKEKRPRALSSVDSFLNHLNHQINTL